MKSLLALLLVLTTGPAALAQCCKHCGCSSDCQKVCRVICEIKKVPKVTFDCECEDFCVPGKSCRTTEYDECGKKKHVYTPGCGTVRTRTKLVKHETFEEKVTYKWVVETLCCGCAERCAAADQNPPTVAPSAVAMNIPAAANGATVQPASFQAAGSAPATPQVTPPGEPAREVSRFDLRRIFRPLAAE
jgi:hypothetical protein